MRLNEGLDRALASNENANNAETGTGEEACVVAKGSGLAVRSLLLLCETLSRQRVCPPAGLRLR